MLGRYTTGPRGEDLSTIVGGASPLGKFAGWFIVLHENRIPGAYRRWANGPSYPSRGPAPLVGTSSSDAEGLKARPNDRAGLQPLGGGWTGPWSDAPGWDSARLWRCQMGQPNEIALSLQNHEPHSAKFTSLARVAASS